jgi:hypothetical protein
MSEKKIVNIFKTMKYLYNGNIAYTQDKNLHDYLNLSGSYDAKCKKVERYLKEISELYSNIIVIEKTKAQNQSRSVNGYRLIDKRKDLSKILKFFFENNDNQSISWLLQAVYENDPKLLDDNDFKKSIEQDKEIFLFVSNPFEKLDDNKTSIFENAKTAVKEKEYRDIVKNDDTVLKDVKCLKLIYMNNNWYLAIEHDDKPKLLRLIFIKDIKYCMSGKEGYQKKVLDKYQRYFKSLQNPFTLNREFKTAHLKIDKASSHYFKPDMKPFFPSQKFVKTHPNGDIEITVDYTQSKEILPFIKQWIPSIDIISPSDLKKKLHEQLSEYINSCDS